MDPPKDAVKKAIAQGQALIKSGKSKSEASQAMYALLKDEPREVTVAAFVTGASLTEKGALTYWYNCKRRAEKQVSPK
ncbi:hypothetical protein CJD38_18115 [Stenotrophobium rhamnosiphilum]|uniref:KfrA N-terminal DNA-binding domain-containing protein n=1 Tax=Stenotrophobium rhamnosiphilum TaxID=2029166 RepID=A0A2T5MB36_9GAMM|nr:hypothetical protein CJD38_18115 [Stenotrophobium rhamnosiphilum]